MAQASNRYIAYISIAYFQVWLCFLEQFHLFPSKMASADTMLEPFMHG
jgi:hypothetical protein